MAIDRDAKLIVSHSEYALRAQLDPDPYGPIPPRLRQHRHRPVRRSVQSRPFAPRDNDLAGAGRMGSFEYSKDTQAARETHISIIIARNIIPSPPCLYNQSIP